MKNLIKKIFVLALLLMPFYVNAYSQEIENFYVKGVVSDNGDLTVEYYFNMNLTQYNGFGLDISYINPDLYDFNSDVSSYGASKLNNATGIELLEVRGVDVDPNFDFNNINGDLFKKSLYASVGDYGVYELSNRTNGISLKIYNPSSKGKAFYVKFKLKNIAVLHNDIGELYYNIFNKSFRDGIDFLKGDIYFPNNDAELKVWAHGPLTGNVLNKEGHLYFEMEDVNPYTAIDVRATFSKNVISKSSKKSNVSALEKILLYEEDKAAQANYEREQEEKKLLSSIDDRLSLLEKNLTSSNYELVKTPNLRYSYNEIYSDSTKILDKEKKLEIEKRLLAVDTKLIEYEKEYAKKTVSDFEENITRENYNIVINAISAVKDENLKNELSKKVIDIKVKLDEKEKNEILEEISYLKKSLNYSDYLTLYKKINELDNKINKEYLNEELTKVYFLIEKHEKDEQIPYYVIAVVLFMSIVGLGILVYLKCFKKYKTEFNGKYYRDFPDGSAPEIVSYLMNRKLTDNALSAAMLELIRKKYITYKQIDKKNYEISKNINENEVNLKQNERDLLKIIFAKKDVITTKELKKYGSSSYSKVYRLWTDYKDNIEEEFDDRKLYEVKSKKGKTIVSNSNILVIFIIFISMGFPIIIPFIPLILLIKTLVTKFDTKIEKVKKIYITFLWTMIPLSIALIIYINIKFSLVYTSVKFYVVIIILSIIMLIYTYTKERRSKEGEELYKKWEGLKNFLDDFGKFENKELPEINLWEKYLVYATLFGNAKKVSEVMKLKVKELNMQSEFMDVDVTDLYYVNRMLSNSLRSSVNAATSAKIASERSSSSGGGSYGGFSSGSGGGGGFSSGGGGGGGGTGGGHF